MAPDIEVRPESGLWKDSLNKNTIEELAEQLGRTYKKFDRDNFVAFILTTEFFNLELKERISKIADALKEFLPKKYPQAINVIKKTAPEVGGFENWALLMYVEKYGLDYFDDSINAMEVLTKLSTAEFAIRPFMIRYTDKMMPILHRWTKDKNKHIRRLAAEGSRPRGVWVAHIEQFKKDPNPVLELLEHLKADDSLYVRKAVANNLNDISKEHPELVVQTGKKWLKEKNKDTDWIVKHACRSLLKKGEPDVFSLFGFTDNPEIEISKFKLNKKKFTIGDKGQFSFELKSLHSKQQKLAIDYIVYYKKKNGKLSPKVFKFSEKKLKPNEHLTLSTKHSFENMSTRKHYAGKHKVELIVNGKKYSSIDFSLV